MYIARWGFVMMIVGVGGHLVSPEAMAQYVPYARYGGWGTFPSPSQGVVDRGVMAQQQGEDRRQALAQNFAQHQAMNQFLVGQAQQRAATSAGGAASVNELRMQTLASQATPRATEPPAGFAPLATPLPLRLPPLSSASSHPSAPTEADAAGSSPSTSAAESEELRWPTLLRTSAFDEPRQEIERVVTAAEARASGGLTEGECHEIVGLLAQMKGILRGLAPQLNAAEYLAVARVLDDLTARAQAAVKSTK